jgi:hypothetical protein
MTIGPFYVQSGTVQKYGRGGNQAATPSVASPNPQPTPHIEQNRPTGEPERFHSESLWKPLRDNWPLVVVGVLGIWAALGTLKVIERQADAMMDADCAMFLVLWENFIHINPNSNGVSGHYFRWTFQNVGKTPGFIKQFGCRFIPIRNLGDLPPEPKYLNPVDADSEVEPVIPGKSYERLIYAALETDLPHQEMEEKYRTKNCLLYAYGFVKYWDMYGRVQETRFGAMFECGPIFSSYDDKFRLAGPKSYNRYRKPDRKKWYQNMTAYLKAQIEKMSAE